MAIERIPITLPPGFDPRRHQRALLALIAKTHGEGFEIESIDPDQGVAIAARQTATTEVRATSNSSFDVKLARGTKPSDGEKTAARLEDQHAGYFMTKFDPFLGQATLSKLSDDEARCRGAVAVALSCKPWDIEVKQMADGGYELKLPRTYMPSKHHEKLEEVATGVVGRDGWYVSVNAQALTARIIPSDPPTFPEGIGFPMKRLGKGDIDKTPFGMVLPAPGEESGPEIGIDWTASAWALVAGTPGSGKTVSLSAMIADALSNGSELAIVDDVSKAQPLTTRIPTPISEKFKDGWALLGDLEVGDLVYAKDGSAIPVTGLTPIKYDGDVYEVEFSDGQTVQADGGHLWPVTTRVDRAKMSPSYVEDRRRNAEVVAQRKNDRIKTLRARANSMSSSTANATEIARLIERKPEHVLGLIKRFGLVAIDASEARRLERKYVVSEFIDRYADIIGRAQNGGRDAEVPPTYRLLTTAEMAQSVKVTKKNLANYGVPIADPVVGKEMQLPIDPYILGAWLGDGSTLSGNITSGLDDVDEMVEILESAWGHPVRRLTGRPGSTETIALPRPDNHLCPYGHDDFWTSSKGIRRCRACLRAGGQDGHKNMSLYSLLEREGLRGNKHIPPEYLRASVDQRLALLQGLMDTDGYVTSDGSCVFTAVPDHIAESVVELIRSLGMVPTMSSVKTSLTEDDGKGGRRRRWIGTTNVVRFAPKVPVFRLSRKLNRQIETSQGRGQLRYRFIVDIRKVESVPVRCIKVGHHDHLYLTEGFIPTHNCIDFEWCKKYVRPGGWGCDSLEAAVATLGLVREEGKKRAKKLKELGINNWLDMPADQRFTPILVVVDEVSALVVPDPVPKGVPKDHPLFIEIAERNLARAMIQSFMRKIIAELRFVGVRMVLSTQATNANTGVDPAMRTLIGHKILQGVNPSRAARSQIFADETSVPTVPENVKAGGKRAKGVGVAHLESAAPEIYKSYFATTDAYAQALDALGVPVPGNPEPTAAQIDHFLPSLDDGKNDDSGGRPGGDPRGEVSPFGKSAAQIAAEMGDTVGMAAHDGSLGKGFEKANNMRNLAAGGGQTRSQKKAAAEEAEWAAKSGEVTVRRVQDEPADPSADGW